jgi:hypothetical protein
MNSNILFSKYDIYGVLENQREAVKKEVYALDSNYLCESRVETNKQTSKSKFTKAMDKQSIS